MFEGARADLDAGLSNRVVNGNRIPVPTKMAGFYAEVDYSFWLAFLNNTFLARDKPSFTLALRYDEIDTDDNRTTAGGDRQRLSFGFNFRPLPETVLKFEWHFDVDNWITRRIWSRALSLNSAVTFSEECTACDRCLSSSWDS